MNGLPGWDDDRFDRRIDKAFDHPFRTFFKAGAVVILLSILFYGAIIAMIVFGLSLVL